MKNIGKWYKNICVILLSTDNNIPFTSDNHLIILYSFKSRSFKFSNSLTEFNEKLKILKRKVAHPCNNFKTFDD